MTTAPASYTQRLHDRSATWEPTAADDRVAATRAVAVVPAPNVAGPSGRVTPDVRRDTIVLPTLRLESGEALRNVRLRCTLIGTVNADASNVVLVAHALTGTADVHEWWAPIVGPGRALDPATHAILCVNVLGGCAGSTGPRVGDERAFPTITTRDQANALWAVLDALGIASLTLVAGGSLGGMVALEVAALRPSNVGEVVVLAAPAAQTALGAGWHAIMRTAVSVGGAQQGLALARMAGMLSYRSAAGFEQRFGADRASDGTPTIAAWLSRHGERLVERFDAASYVTLLDAMDRHDVARGRGSLSQALGAMASRITGVGIAGDLLYPDVVVQQWTTEIGARYVALDSLHGHDAFLLEVAQVSAILRDALQRSSRTSTAPAAPSHPSAPCTEGPVPLASARAGGTRIALAGCGVVGDAFAAALARGDTRETSLGHVLVRDPARVRPGLEAVAAATARPTVTRDVQTLLAAKTDVLVEALGGIEPAYTLVSGALARGTRVVTANKELVAAHGPELLALAEQHGTTFDFEGAVAASVPVIRLLRGLASDTTISRVCGILNGTTNYVLDAIADGTRVGDAVRLAQAAGFAEADPSRDLDGRDIEAKARILGWLAFGVSPLAIRVQRRGLDDAVARWARVAARTNDRIRLLVTIDRVGEEVLASIAPVRVPRESEWGAVRGVQNRVVIESTAGGRWALHGPGAGGDATARALLSDLRASPSLRGAGPSAT